MPATNHDHRAGQIPRWYRSKAKKGSPRRYGSSSLVELESETFIHTPAPHPRWWRTCRRRSEDGEQRRSPRDEWLPRTFFVLSPSAFLPVALSRTGRHAWQWCVHLSCVASDERSRGYSRQFRALVSFSRLQKRNCFRWHPTPGNVKRHLLSSDNTILFISSDSKFLFISSDNTCLLIDFFTLYVVKGLRRSFNFELVQSACHDSDTAHWTIHHPMTEWCRVCRCKQC